MKVTFLGTSSVVPGGDHDTASILINGAYLFDTGWYATIRMRAFGFDPMALRAVLLTHCHHDHYIGLPQVLFYLCMRRKERPERSPLRIVGPAEDLERIVALAREFLQPSRFPDVNYVPELVPLRPGESVEDESLRIETCETVHPVPGLCYRVTERSTGATCALTGDTAYHPPIAAHVQGVSLLVHEASYGSRSVPVDARWGHSGAPEAARIAREAGVQRLALIHCAEDQQAAALEAARCVFPETFYPEEGETVTLD